MSVLYTFYTRLQPQRAANGRVLTRACDNLRLQHVTHNNVSYTK